MAENTESPPPADTPPPEDKKSGFTRWLPQILTGLFVLGVVLIECAAAYVLLPSREDLQTWANERHQGQSNLLPETDETEPISILEDDSPPTSEVEMGQFSITAFQPVANTTLRIDFYLWGTVFEDTLSEFNKSWERNENRIREQVIVTVRASEVTDLTDAGWGHLKRKILDKTNRTLGRPLVQDVIFSEFAFVEQ